MIICTVQDSLLGFNELLSFLVTRKQWLAVRIYVIVRDLGAVW